MPKNTKIKTKIVTPLCVEHGCKRKAVVPLCLQHYNKIIQTNLSEEEQLQLTRNHDDISLIDDTIGGD